MDRRQKKTRKAVLNAFEQLISQERYRDITVQEIIDRADIGRTTFYANFETKDSVLDALCEDLFNHIFEEPLEKEETHNFSGEAHSEENLLTHILYHLKEDHHRYGRLLTGESADLFWRPFKIRFEEKLREAIDAGKWHYRQDLPQDLYRRLFVSGFVETVTWWFLHDCSEAPEQIESWLEHFCGSAQA